MKTLDGMCRALQQALSETSRQGKAILERVDKFTTNISVFPLTMVQLRLQLIAGQIMVWALSLYVHHDNKGVVFVIRMETGMGVYWSETEYSDEDKDWFKARGSLIVSPEGVNEEIDQLIDGLESGHWSKALDWIHRYEGNLVSDATKYG